MKKKWQVIYRRFVDMGTLPEFLKDEITMVP